MSALEELQGLIATWHLRGKEGGYITVQAVRKWAQEVRGLQQQIAEFAEDWKTNFEQYEAQILQLQEEVKRLEIANAQLQQQLAIAEIGEDPLREL